MKKLWIIPVAVLVLGAIIGGVIVMSQKKEETVSPDARQASPSPTPTPEELLVWQDEAGFSFKYPASLKTDKHEDDDDNYAHVELTSAVHPGSIIVWASDLPRGVKDVMGWAADKKFATGSAIDSTLGEGNAKKILFAGPPKKIDIGTVSDSLLFHIEGTLIDVDYWTGVFDTISNSFSFGEQPSASAGQASGTAGGEEPVDETEVIE